MSQTPCHIDLFCCDDSRSKAGWASKERSTPEGYNREEHAWRFEPPFPGMSIIDDYLDAFPPPDVVRPPKKKKSPEERKAIRENRLLQNERASLCHAETALRKYNRANNTTVRHNLFVLLSLAIVICYYLN